MVVERSQCKGESGMPILLDPKLGHIRDRSVVVVPTYYARKIPLALLAFLFFSGLLTTASAWRLGSGNVPALAQQDTRHQRAEEISSSDKNHPSRKFSKIPADPLRKFIGDSIMSLPDLVASEETLLGTLNIMISNFRCFDASFGEVTIDLMEAATETERDGKGDSFLRLEITDAVFRCSMNVTWNYGHNGNQNGAGNASLISNKNYLTALVSTTENFIPKTDDKSSCEGTTIDLGTLEFDGDLSLQLMNVYRYVYWYC
jgi:hypothetical protein